MYATTLRFSVIMFALATGQASAATLNLNLNANGTGRWYEYFSNAYAQIDQGHSGNPVNDGFFDIDTNGQYGPADVFPFEGAFATIGTLDYDDTGLGGNGVAPITGLSLDFDEFVAGGDNILNLGYSTTVANPVGTVALAGGQVIGIGLNSAITFTYDATSAGLGLLAYDGTFSIAGSSFDLNVDETIQSAVGALRYRWDIDGTVANVVPEPNAAGLLIAASGFVLGMYFARRRAAC